MFLGVLSMFFLSKNALALKNGNITKNPTWKNEKIPPKIKTTDFPKIRGNSIINAKITEINGGVLKLEKDGKTYTIQTSDKTVLKRRFWGKSSLSEFSVGDMVNVTGQWTNEEKTEMNAVWIRNLSIQKRFTVFWGTVKVLNSDNFVFESEKRGEQTVFFDSNTKWFKRGEKTASYSDLKVGDKVKVKGDWDSALNKITNVTYVKDNSKN